MLVRILAVITIIALVGNGLFAKENKVPDNEVRIKVGSNISFTMTGDLAKHFSRYNETFKGKKLPDDILISTGLEIIQILDNGRVRVEHTSITKRAGREDFLVTLTGTVDRNQFTTQITPKGTPQYDTPLELLNDKTTPSSITKKETKYTHLQLSNLKNLKLQKWTLKEEIGE